MPLFEVAIIQAATKKEIDDGKGVEKLVFGPKFVLAKDAQTAAMSAMLDKDTPRDLDLTRAQVLTRPFA